jgi:alkaline phosphatase D
MRKISPLILLLLGIQLFAVSAFCQYVSGPMLGQVEIRTAKIWVEVKPQTKKLSLRYWKKDKPSVVSTQTATPKPAPGTHRFYLRWSTLDMNTAYEYEVVIESAKTERLPKADFHTLELWQWRKPAPDFIFLTGSCAYFNEPMYDRPGKPMVGDSSIFETMGKEKAAFMMWWATIGTPGRPIILVCGDCITGPAGTGRGGDA